MLFKFWALSQAQICVRNRIKMSVVPIWSKIATGGGKRKKPANLPAHKLPVFLNLFGRDGRI